ncbi:HAD-IB family phosphatase, partial [Amaricoccus sp.]|uniref:HAD-IB family phosphatase n=1 Tax=Amaricoccus sp. TaxID=1872485 RepID=UPI0026082D67
MAPRLLVLTAAAGVPEAVATAAARALGGEARRLADTAVEVAFAGAVPDGLAVPGCDANIVPAEGRRKRILVADMDSTIIGVECIDELADFAGFKAEVAAITEAAMRGELDFEAALTARVGLLQGLPAGVLEECYAERVRLNPGARTLVATMAALGAETALVSGGFTYFSERVAQAAGFARHQANELLIADGALTGDVARPILGRVATKGLADELYDKGYLIVDGTDGRVHYVALPP